MKLLKLPSEVEALDNWLFVHREAYRKKISARTKELPPDHPKDWRECFCLRALLKHHGWAEIFGEEFVAEHTDDGHGGPDFILTLGDGSLLALEVTEATTPEDRLAIKRGRIAEAVHLIGELGGRGRGGFAGTEPERLVGTDIANAIQRKSDKRYNERCALLIYVNSNPSRVVNEVDALVTQVSPLPRDSPFEFALVLASGLPLVHVSRSYVSIHREKRIGN